MTNYLDKIIETKSEVLAEQKKQTSLPTLKSQLSEIPQSRPFIDSIKMRNEKGLVSVIAEIKKASPSKGVIREDFLPVRIAKQYQENGATCLSVLTDAEYFQGSLNYLKEIRSEVDIPLLRKDFIIDQYQIYQSKIYGADCILLIVSVLSDEQLQEYKQLADELNLDVLVEVHNENEMERILPLDFSLIGINNRNLTTFEVNLETTKNLSRRLEGKLVVSESGIRTKEDIDEILSYDVLNFLVGESFMRADDPGIELNKLFSLL